jgi:hypothetical protein
VSLSLYTGKSFGPCSGSGNSFDGHRTAFNFGDTAFVYAVPSGFTAGWLL